MTKQKTTLQSVKSLSTEEPNENYVFAEHLKAFIEGKTDNEKIQKEMLEIAKKQFAGHIDKIDPECKKCYGRGYIAYNTTYKYFVPCSKCFKSI